MRRRTGLDELHCTVVVEQESQVLAGPEVQVGADRLRDRDLTVGIECRVELLGHAPRLRGRRVGSVRNQVRTSDP